MSTIARVYRRDTNLVEAVWDFRPDARGYNAYASSSSSFAVTVQLNANEIPNARVPLASGRSSNALDPAQNRVAYSFAPATSGFSNDKALYLKIETILVDTGLPEEILANVPYLVIYPKGVNPPTEKDSIDRNQHLYGWDYTNNVWRKVAVDDQGRLVISP